MKNRTYLPGKNHAEDSLVNAMRSVRRRRLDADYRRKRVNDWCNQMQRQINFWFSDEKELSENAAMQNALEAFRGGVLLALNAQEVRE